jgi:hypothetical protein
MVNSLEVDPVDRAPWFTCEIGKLNPKSHSVTPFFLAPTTASSRSHMTISNPDQPWTCVAKNCCF